MVDFRMPKFTVEHTTSLSAQETFTKVKDYLSHSEGLRKLDGDMKCDFHDSSMSGKVKGSKFECDVAVKGSSPTTVVLTINIGLLLSPFKGKIHETLKEKMTKILG